MDVHNALDIYLYELKGSFPDESKPWTKPGMYYIGVSLGVDYYQYYYTEGKTLEELGINAKGLVPKSEYGKLPMYKLELMGNTLDYEQITFRQMDRGGN